MQFCAPLTFTLMRAAGFFMLCRGEILAWTAHAVHRKLLGSYWPIIHNRRLLPQRNAKSAKI